MSTFTLHIYTAEENERKKTFHKMSENNKSDWKVTNKSRKNRAEKWMENDENMEVEKKRNETRRKKK